MLPPVSFPARFLAAALSVAHLLALTDLTAAPDSQASAPLRLLGVVGDAKVELKDIGANRFIAEDANGRRSVPLDAPIEISGDLATNGRFILWHPTYYLARTPGRDSLPASHRPWFGYVRLVNGSFWRGPALDDLWNDPLRDPALAVFAWINQGRVVRAAAQRLRSDPRGQSFRIDHMFQLTEPEAAAGFAVMLLWSKGRFIAPKPSFRDSRAQVAFQDMMLGRQAAFEAALAGSTSSSVIREKNALLAAAAAAGLAEAVSVLLRHGADASLSGAHGPLAAAALRGRVAVIDRLLQDKPELRDPPPLELALGWGHNEAVQRILTHTSANARVSGSMIETALEHGFTDLARELLRRGDIDPRSTRRHGEILLRQIDLGHAAAAQLLLERKADPNVAIDGRTPLGEAARLGRTTLVEALLRAGAKPNVADLRGTTPLLYACLINDLPSAKRLLAAGADPKFQRKDGNTALHFAAVHESPELAALLLAAGASVNAGGQRPSPLELALLAGAPRTAEALAAAGARLDLDWVRHDRTLAAAVRLDVAVVVTDALARGWMPDVVPISSWSAEAYATLAGASRVRTVLAQARPLDAPSPTTPELVPVAELDSPLQPLRLPAPPDVREGHARRAPPNVQLRAVIDDKGRLECARVHQSNDGRLSFAALQAVAQWQFQPPLKHGRPVCTEVVFPVEFESVAREIYDLSEVDSAPLNLTYSSPFVGIAVDFDPRTRDLRADVAGFTNDVRVQIVVTNTGHVLEPRVLNLVEERERRGVLEAMTNWLYTPATRNGNPVATRLAFTLER